MNSKELALSNREQPIKSSLASGEHQVLAIFPKKMSNNSRMFGSCSTIKSGISTNLHIQANIKNPFIVIKKTQALPNKRPLHFIEETITENSHFSEENVDHEPFCKKLKGQTKILNLKNNQTLKASNQKKIYIAPQFSFRKRNYFLRPLGSPNKKPSIGKNSDLQQEYNENFFILNQLKVPKYISELSQSWFSKENIEKKKCFFESFKLQRRQSRDKTDSFFDLKFPLDLSCEGLKTINGDFVFDLEIISNKNEKEKIKVSFQPNKILPIEKIPNKMDNDAREKFYRQFKFITDYKSGYTPIDIQDRQEKEFSYKDHFIKKYSNFSNQESSF